MWNIKIVLEYNSLINENSNFILLINIHINQFDNNKIKIIFRCE